MAGTYGTTYAIHGTNNNQAIGKWTTLGCIRMYNNDIHWLFERIPQQATVTVKITSKARFTCSQEFYVLAYFISSFTVAKQLYLHI